MKFLQETYKTIIIIILFCLTVSGCSKDNQSKEEFTNSDISKVENSDQNLPPFEINADAPKLSSVYPRLTSGPLSFAKLMDMSDEILIRTENYTLTKSDLQSEFEKIPVKQREDFGNNTFIIADQIASSIILEQQARAELLTKGEDVASMDQNMLIQTWISGKVSGITVSEEELKSFFENNQEMTGGASYEQIKPQIQNYLMQQKQQETVQKIITDLGNKVQIAVNSKWAKNQDEIGRDNDVDRARDSGKVTMANFGADSCVPCQQMKPIREAIEKKYNGIVNIVYVHADKNRMVASRYGIRGIPHIIFFDADGNIFQENTGVMSEDQIEELFVQMGVEKL